MAGTDLIAWRNSANTGNLTLGPSGVAAAPFDADLLVFSGNGIKASEFVSPTLPATTGLLRLSDSEVIAWRNHANSGNISIVHNTDDSLTLPVVNVTSLAASTTVTGGTNVIGTVKVTTPLLVGDTSAALSINAGPTAGSNISITATAGVGAGGLINITGGAASAGSGGGISLTGGIGSTGNSGGAINLNGGTAAGGTTGLLTTNTHFGSYNNINTVGNGVPSQIVTVDLTAQTAAQVTAPFYVVPSTGGGQYRLSWNAKVTTPATTGAATSTLGALTIAYTDPDSVVQTITCGAQTSAGAIATTSATNTTLAVLLGLPFMMNVKASTTITWAFAYASNTAAQMAYNIHIRLEAL